jgi:hypothetical protein
MIAERRDTPALFPYDEKSSQKWVCSTAISIRINSRTTAG